MKTYFAIVDENGNTQSVGETEGDPTEGRSPEEIANLRTYATLREREEDAPVSHFQRHRALDRVELEIEAEKSDDAYAAKLRAAEAWLDEHPARNNTPPRAVWERDIQRGRYRFLADEVEERDSDPWVVAEDIVGAVDRGTRAKERARIKRREWLKRVRRGDD